MWPPLILLHTVEQLLLYSYFTFITDVANSKNTFTNTTEQTEIIRDTRYIAYDGQKDGRADGRMERFMLLVIYKLIFVLKDEV